jgi:hypothetical protein
MRQDARENRERILAAAVTVVGEQGATGSTEEVARLAAGSGLDGQGAPSSEPPLAKISEAQDAAVGVED